MKKYIGLFISLLIICGLTACGSPNNIVMTTTQGQCVQLSQYPSVIQPVESAAFPFLSTNPATSPYCISVTVQNNNSGTNANGVQVVNNGVTIQYNIGSLVESAILYDPAAATVTIVAMPNESQTVGGIAIFDPENCATSSGVNMITLQPGNSCTFYLQLLGNALPVGVYSTQVMYNYTNGNQNYMIESYVNQRIYLYAGAPSGLYYEPNSAPSGAGGAAWVANPIGIPLGNIGATAQDNFGNLYVGVNQQVYMYNGVKSTQLGAPLASNVTALALDVNNNLYAGTESSGLFIYGNPAATHTWQAFTDNSGNLTATSAIIALVGQKFNQITPASQNLYAFTANSAFKCVVAESTTLVSNCKFTNITGNPPATFNPNAVDIDAAANLYTGAAANAYMYSESTNTWASYTFNNGSGITGDIFGVNYAQFASNPVYFSEINATNPNESAVYSCTNNKCISLLSDGDHAITGNAYAITTDGAGDVYIVGNMLNSSDFGTGITNASGAYLYVGAAGSVWQPIAPGAFNGPELQNVLVSSIFTTY